METQHRRRRVDWARRNGLVAATALAADPSAEALWDAARQGDLAAVKRPIEGGLDVNTKTKYGATALSCACDRGHLDVVRYLVEKGADVNGPLQVPSGAAAAGSTKPPTSPRMILLLASRTWSPHAYP